MNRPRQATLLHLDYALFYFGVFSNVALLLAFVPLYCESLGFDRRQIAALSVAINAANMIAAPLALNAAHHWISPRSLARACSILALAALLPLLFSADFTTITAFWFVSMTGTCGAAALVDAQAVRASAESGLRFERVRMAGSIGFIATSLVIGLLVDRLDVAVVLPAVFSMSLLILAASRVVSRHLPESARKLSGRAEEQSEAGGRGGFPALVVAVALAWASHATLYVYFSLYLAGLGWSGTAISAAWNIGVISEIVFFLLFRRLEAALDLVVILRISLAVAALRWTLLAVSSEPALIFLTQALHAFSFGGVYLASLKLTFAILPPDRRDRGQGILAAMGAGLGSLSGRLLVGWMAGLLAAGQSLAWLFPYSSGLALCALAAAMLVPRHSSSTIGTR